MFSYSVVGTFFGPSNGGQWAEPLRLEAVKWQPVGHPLRLEAVRWPPVGDPGTLEVVG